MRITGNWAADKEGMTGDALQKFIDQDLFPTLRNLDLSTGNQRARIVREIFEGTNNYMKNGTIIRQVLNSLNEIDFENSEDRHLFGGYLRDDFVGTSVGGGLWGVLYAACADGVYDGDGESAVRRKGA